MSYRIVKPDVCSGRCPSCVSRPSRAGSAAPGSSAACVPTSDDAPDLADTEVTVIGNTGDDITLFGLRVCPDLDTLLYTLGGGVDEGRGWGRAERAPGAPGRADGLRCRAAVVHPRRQGLRDPHRPLAVARPGADPQRGDRAARGPVGPAGAAGHAAADDRPARRDPRRRRGGGRARAVHFQEWWVRMRAEPSPRCRFVAAGHGPRERRARGPRRDPRCGRRPPPAEQPRRLHRDHPRRPRGARRPPRHDRPRRRRLAAHLRGSRSAATQTRACRRSGSSRRAEAVAGLYEDFLDGWLVDPADAGAAAGRRRGDRRTTAPLLMSDVDVRGPDRRRPRSTSPSACGAP